MEALELVRLHSQSLIFEDDQQKLLCRTLLIAFGLLCKHFVVKLPAHHSQCLFLFPLWPILLVFLHANLSGWQIDYLVSDYLGHDNIVEAIEVDFADLGAGRERGLSCFHFVVEVSVVV